MKYLADEYGIKIPFRQDFDAHQICIQTPSRKVSKWNINRTVITMQFIFGYGICTLIGKGFANCWLDVMIVSQPLFTSVIIPTYECAKRDCNVTTGPLRARYRCTSRVHICFILIVSVCHISGHQFFSLVTGQRN